MFDFIFNNLSKCAFRKSIVTSLHHLERSISLLFWSFPLVPASFLVNSFFYYFHCFLSSSVVSHQLVNENVKSVSTYFITIRPPDGCVLRRRSDRFHVSCHLRWKIFFSFPFCKNVQSLKRLTAMTFLLKKTNKQTNIQ